MCKPVIAQDGYDDGLMLFCAEHNTREPVMENGTQAYQVDVLTHTDMLISHRAQYNKPIPSWQEWAKSLSDKMLKP